MGKELNIETMVSFEGYRVFRSEEGETAEGEYPVIVMDGKKVAFSGELVSVERFCEQIKRNVNFRMEEILKTVKGSYFVYGYDTLSGGNMLCNIGKGKFAKRNYDRIMWNYWCDWRNNEIELPVTDDEQYLVIIDGKCGNRTYENAYMLATYSEKEGWIVEGLEEYENVNVRYWLPLPKAPRS